MRQRARQTEMPKRSVHRLKQAMERRDYHPESWWWETEDGRRWLTRLVVAALSPFGLKRGVGLETLSEFFTPLRLTMQGGVALGLTRGDGSAGGRDAGDDRGVGARRGDRGREAREHWGGG